MHSIYEIPVWSVVVFTLQFWTYTLHTPVVHHKRPIHTYINYIMIFVLSFTAVVFLVQKFDFRNCMLKSTTKNGNDFPSSKDPNDDDDDYDRSNDSFQTIWCWMNWWLDGSTPNRHSQSDTSTVCICTAHNYIRQKFVAIFAIIIWWSEKIFPMNREKEKQRSTNSSEIWVTVHPPIFDIYIF